LPDDAPIRCGNCRAELPPAHWRGEEFGRCLRCGEPVAVMVFPAILEGPPDGLAGEQRVDESAASCFFHPDRQAVRACDHCGRFVCSLCELDLGSRHLCPTCLENADKDRGIPINLERKRLCHEEIAFLMAAVPLVFGLFMWWLWIVTGPAAVFMALWFWRRSSKFGTTGTLKRLAAIVIGSGQVIAWLVVFASIWEGFVPYQN
jgi:hypothetical protein